MEQLVETTILLGINEEGGRVHRAYIKDNRLLAECSVTINANAYSFYPIGHIVSWKDDKITEFKLESIAAIKKRKEKK